MKQTIPGALREQVWLLYCGETQVSRDTVLTPFMFEVGHNLPESKGGTIDIDNLRPICAKCNRSMGDHYTIDEFSLLSKRTSHLWECFRMK